MLPIPFPKTSGLWIIVRNLPLVQVKGNANLARAVYDYWQDDGGWSTGGSKSRKFSDRDGAVQFIRDNRAELS